MVEGGQSRGADRCQTTGRSAAGSITCEHPRQLGNGGCRGWSEYLNGSLGLKVPVKVERKVDVSSAQPLHPVIKLLVPRSAGLVLQPLQEIGQSIGAE